MKKFKLTQYTNPWPYYGDNPQGQPAFIGTIKTSGEWEHGRVIISLANRGYHPGELKELGDLIKNARELLIQNYRFE